MIWGIRGCGTRPKMSSSGEHGSTLTGRKYASSEHSMDHTEDKDIVSSRRRVDQYKELNNVRARITVWTMLRLLLTDQGEDCLVGNVSTISKERDH
jgi:hypothetical protein